jgi:hypothetical protein
MKIYSLEQGLYYYNIETFVSKWYHPKLLKYNYYKTINDFEKIRNGLNIQDKIKCGWHFSYFGDEKFIKNKITQFSHQEFNNNKFIDIDNIITSIHMKKDIYGRKLRFKHIPLNKNSYIPENYKMLL